MLLAALKTVTMPTMSQFPNLNTARRGKEDQFQNFQTPRRRKAKVPVSEFSIQSEIEDAACQAHTDTDPSARKEGKRGEAEIENSSEVSET